MAAAAAATASKLPPCSIERSQVTGGELDAWAARAAGEGGRRRKLFHCAARSMGGPLARCRGLGFENRKLVNAVSRVAK